MKIAGLMGWWWEESSQCQWKTAATGWTSLLLEDVIDGIFKINYIECR